MLYTNPYWFSGLKLCLLTDNENLIEVIKYSKPIK